MPRASRTLLFGSSLFLKNNNTLEIEHSLLTLLLSFSAIDFISGQLISPTNPIHRISGSFCKQTANTLL